MSDVIKLLPDHIANQIAAGEVIQRPASVVKEMVENAIDAGASKIQLIIKEAGKTLIQVIDNGVGMTEKDAVLSFERHATSKVSKADDLFALTTKGFRGEALASIAAIAHVTLRTRQASNDVGTLIEIEGSNIKVREACTCAVGTSFEVKNLFYNVPARRNFLKSNSVEFNHIVDEVERIALAHPDLQFNLYHNDQEIYALHATTLRKRIVDILGKNATEKLVPIEETTDIVNIIGYVGKPDFAKKTRGEQFLFVNDRFFKDPYFNHALTKAFEGLLPPKYFPSYFLYLTVNPKKIDVNVHPTKTEIKFEEDRFIYAILLSSIRQALGKYNVAPTLDFEQETSFTLPHEMRNQPIVEPTIKVNPTYNPFQQTSQATSISSGNSFTKAIRAEGFGAQEVKPSDWQNFYKIVEEEEPAESPKLEIEIEQATQKNFLMKEKYIITTCKSGLLVIDTTRAVERIVYDDIITRFIAAPITSQTMLFPIEREFSNNEKKEWINNHTMLERLGFVTEFRENQLLINAVPAILQEESIHECINFILEIIAYQEVAKGDIAHLVVQSIARAAGRRKSFISTNEAAEQLVEQLFQCSEHTFTPSGKTIIQTIQLDEISQQV